MNAGTSTLFGAFLATAAAWLGLMFVPFTQTGAVKPTQPLDGYGVYPRPVQGEAERGRAVYIANGCAECHSQQVRPASGDVARGWGVRPTVPGDFQFEAPPLPGRVRIGPDLANAGDRIEDEHWLYRHLFYPKANRPDTNMPSYRHLFTYRKVVGQPSDRVILAPDEKGEMAPWNFKGVPSSIKPEKGYQVLVSDEARALAAYLKSLDRSTPLEPSGVTVAE